MAMRRAVRQHLPSLIRRAVSSGGTANSGSLAACRSVSCAMRSVSTSVPSGEPSVETSFVSQATPVSPFAAAAAAASSAYTSPATVAAENAIRDGPRNDWSREEIQAIYDSPLLDLLFYGAQVHRHSHKFREVQQCTLLSIKTGGCSEDCSYCPQSSRYNTEVKAQKLLGEDAVLTAAKKAKEAGSTRFCMGAAWRDTVGRKTNFNQILSYVKEIRGMGMEVCCTLGMLEKKQAEQLKEAGLTAYNPQGYI
ncbi:hypothetical protein R1flu_014316 [Riccia fluitans]|uniref:Radical SAM core domain-containing protein n=1 Tax=Riccia fluitans TaxID=41844 RepID=A0ABD1YG31_9MARC